MTDLLDRLEGPDRVVVERQSDWRPPMLARGAQRRFSDPDWLFERKLEGERVLAFRDRDRVRLLSRNLAPLNGSYPELVYYEGACPRYAGKVGTGSDDLALADLRRRLDRVAIAGSPFQDEIRDASVTFVQPRLAAEIGFTEWTADGRLRHPRFLGLRRDKPLQEVGRERSKPR